MAASSTTSGKEWVLEDNSAHPKHASCRMSLHCNAGKVSDDWILTWASRVALHVVRENVLTSRNSLQAVGSDGKVFLCKAPQAFFCISQCLPV